MLIKTFSLFLFAPGALALITESEGNLQVYTEPEFTSGFLIPASVAVEDYGNYTELMVPVDSLDKSNDFDLEPSDFLSAAKFFDFQDSESAISERQTQKTNVLVGKTQTDYGCDASIRKTLTEAIHSLCRNGLCDAGSKYSRKVKWLNGKPFTDAHVQVTIEGHYDGPKTRGYTARLVENLVTPKTAIPAWREYHHQSQHNYYTHACKMSKFGNYIAIHKRFSPNPVDIRIRISLHVSNQRCIGQRIFSELFGAVNPWAGAFFKSLVGDCS